jgi:predicted O-methyltransferase YrrM
MRNNNHIKCNHGEEYCGCFPKHLKSYYDISKAGMYYDFNNYKDVPGWINDAEFIYPKMVENAQDGFHFVEIGVLFGQSTTHMAQLIKDSGKDIKFDAIDIFWVIESIIQNYEITSQPHEFFQYLESLSKFNLTILDMIKYPLYHFGTSEYVNFITCDERYAHKLYDDNSLDFVWIDGDHGTDIVYNDLINFWPKLKKDGVIGGDDIFYDEVSSDIDKFKKEHKVDVKYLTNGFMITK